MAASLESPPNASKFSFRIRQPASMFASTLSRSETSIPNPLALEGITCIGPLAPLSGLSPVLNLFSAQPMAKPKLGSTPNASQVSLIFAATVFCSTLNLDSGSAILPSKNSITQTLCRSLSWFRSARRSNKTLL